MQRRPGIGTATRTSARLALAGAVLALAACGGSDDAAPTAAPATTAATTASTAGSATATSPIDGTAPAPGAVAPATDPTGETGGAVVADPPDALAFSAPLIGGGDIEMASLAGRPVLLWFWAPW
jgi:hypothetical protein